MHGGEHLDVYQKSGGLSQFLLSGAHQAVKVLRDLRALADDVLCPHVLDELTLEEMVTETGRVLPEDGAEVGNGVRQV